MPNSPHAFAFGEIVVRTTGDGFNPWFVATDICRALEIQNASDAIASLPQEDVSITQMETPGGAQQLATISEPGLYRLIFRSNKPQAETFRKWVFNEVLPAIRRTGSYTLTDHNRLWAAYEQAKTGAVQLAILKHLGIEPAGRPTRLLSAAPIAAVHPHAWWAAFAELVAKNSALFAEHLRIESRSGSYTLAICPGPILECISRHTEEFRNYKQREMRDVLSNTPEWVGGRHTMRVGLPGRTKLSKVWVFRVGSASDQNLQSICSVLANSMATVQTSA